MPFGDGTGPMGMGPMTGRSTGYCAGSPRPGYMNPGCGRGRGRGWRHWCYATGMPGWMRAGHGMPAFGMCVPPTYATPPTPETEANMLKEQAEFLKQRLSEIQKRIDELEKKNL